MRKLQRGLKDGASPSLCQDQITRLSLLSSIHQSLLRTYPEEIARRWLTRARQGEPYNGQTPLAYVRETGIISLYVTRGTLDAVALSNFNVTAENRSGP